MAKCDQGYLCEVCGEEVPHIGVSDLYLRFVIGEIDGRQLLAAPERHLTCNPTLSQFIVDDRFQSVTVDGFFDKRLHDPEETSKREELVSRGWRRLQELKSLRIAINEYPLPEFQKTPKNQTRQN